jgi:hypothetical protein
MARVVEIPWDELPTARDPFEAAPDAWTKWDTDASTGVALAPWRGYDWGLQ